MLEWKSYQFVVLLNFENVPPPHLTWSHISPHTSSQEKYTPRRSLQIHQRKRKAPDSPPLGDDGDDEEEEPHPPSEKRVRQEQGMRMTGL